MTFLETLVAVVIAIYAMVGGAMLNAAVTSPVNTSKLLSAIWSEILQYFVFGTVAILASLIVTFSLKGGLDDFLYNPMLWLGAAHISVFIMFRACRSVCEILLRDSQEAEGGKSD